MNRKMKKCERDATQIMTYIFLPNSVPVKGCLKTVG